MRILLALVIVWVFTAGGQTSQEIWRESSFKDFVDGTFDDVGANTYVSNKGRIQTANRWDVSGDGHIDILSVNSHSLVEMLDMSIYWGNGKDFSIRNHSYIPADGPKWVAGGDLDKDGEIDLVVANYSNGTSTDMETFVYYGGLKDKDPKTVPNEWSFSLFKRRIKLPGSNAQKPAIGAFNKDGHADVFFSNHQHSLSGDPFMANRLIDSYLFYGSDRGFLKENRKSLQTIGKWGANAADLNKDGWVDLLVCNYQEHYSYEVPSFVYWNGPQGFSTTRRTPLYEHGAQGNAVADFNRDGRLDVLTTSMMAGSRADYDPSFLYFGSNRGEYSVDNWVKLAGREAYEQAFADLDDDGQVDVLLLNQAETGCRANELWIYWNGNNRFNIWNLTGLPAHRGLGVEVADLDRNGYLDILISNAIPERDPAEGNPHPGSFIYWGWPQGWPVMDRTSLPIVSTRAVTTCDINSDGHLDLVFGQQGE